MRFSCFECPLIGGDNSGGSAHAAGCGTTDSKSYAGSGLGPVSVNQRGSASDREEVQARIPAACAFLRPKLPKTFCGEHNAKLLRVCVLAAIPRRIHRILSDLRS